MNWAESELAWMAGLLEGEGTFYATSRARMIRCAMTDEDVVRRLHQVSRIGTVYSSPGRNGNKDAWVWQVGRAQEQIPFLTALAPWMGIRRASKIEALLVEARRVAAGYTGLCEWCGADVSGPRKTRFCRDKSTCRVSAHLNRAV